MNKVEKLQQDVKDTQAAYAVTYDAADYLETEEDIKYYWEAIVEYVIDEPELLIVGLGNIARATTNMSQLGRDVNVTRESLYRSFSENGNPSFITVVRMMNALGLNFTGTQAEALK
jgi:probable addiction module antidote protein